MREDLRKKLRDMGVVRGARELAALPPRPRVAIETLVPGRFHTTSHGQCFVAEEMRPHDHLHGDIPLAAFLGLTPDTVARVAQQSTLAQVDLQRSCFLDTETTGLSAGTGTMAFVVGLGFFAGERFLVQQYFLRDPGDELAMLDALQELLPTFDALVTFNGRAFDVPILETRFILARLHPPTAGMPHLDLLPPSRRLWHHSLPSCALGSLEREVLGVLREQDDVPGGVIPDLYRDYLRTGDAREMTRVLYHNTIDILSMVTLAARLCRALADPWDEVGTQGRTESTGLNGGEWYGLGRWVAAEGRLDETERAYRAALQAAHDPLLRSKVLRALGSLLKRTGRPAEAFACWQQLALETTDEIVAHVELAKVYEWQIHHLPLAAGWTRAALALVEGWPRGARRQIASSELRHRLERLERKMEKQGPKPETQEQRKVAADAPTTGETG